jgi:AcrR family transcriptional regulator
MKSAQKLSSEERRADIIRAVRRVFAEHGFHGTTTRELADAAAVSEALLFKHFPNKEALYSAMQLSCCNEQDPERMERINTLEPSTSTLAVIMHLMVTNALGSGSKANEDIAIHHQLMLRSMMEDGEFARLFIQRTMPRWTSKVEDCLRASIAAGEAVHGPVLPKLGALFSKHLAKMIMLALIPETPIFDYGMPQEKLVEQVVWFALRGLGVTEEAIKQHYNSTALAVLMT